MKIDSSIVEDNKFPGRKFGRIGDFGDYYGPQMVGYWLTRQRLASSQRGTLGKWERLCNLYVHHHWYWIKSLRQYLPPECVAPSNQKMRSPRSGISLDEILLALGPNPPSDARSRRDMVRRLLDEPDYIIKGLATFNGLRKVVG